MAACLCALFPWAVKSIDANLVSSVHERRLVGGQSNITEAGHMSQPVVNSSEMSVMQTDSIPLYTPLPLC